jgi:ribosomal protein S18
MAEDRRPSGPMEGGGERRFFAKPKFCQFCADKTLTIDYKKTDLLRKYITEDGKIRPPPDRRLQTSRAVSAISNEPANRSSPLQADPLTRGVKPRGA